MKPKPKQQLSWGCGRAGGEWLGTKISCLRKKIRGGILIGLIILMVQPVSVKAKALNNQDIQDGIPQEIKDYCEEIGHTFNICPEILEAIAWHESRFIPTVKNKKCYGLMQVNVKVHADRIEKYGYTADNMFEPYPNLIVAADYLAELYETYGDENPIVLSLYSGAGWEAVENYKEYGFLTDYVEDILSRSANYERLHGK